MKRLRLIPYPYPVRSADPSGIPFPRVGYADPIRVYAVGLIAAVISLEIEPRVTRMNVF